MLITSIKMQLNDGSTYDSELAYDRLESNVCTVRIVNNHIGILEKTGVNYFSALIEIRKELDAKSIKLLCWGSRKDVWPSPTQNDWVVGLLANSHIMQEQADNDDKKLKGITGNIFAPALAEDVCTVEEQLQYCRSYRNR